MTREQKNALLVVILFALLGVLFGSMTQSQLHVVELFLGDTADAIGPFGITVFAVYALVVLMVCLPVHRSRGTTITDDICKCDLQVCESCGVMSIICPRCKTRQRISLYRNGLRFVVYHGSNVSPPCTPFEVVCVKRRTT